MMEISIIPLSDRLPKKWDLADQFPEGITIQDLLDTAQIFTSETFPTLERKTYLTEDEAIEEMNQKYVIVLHNGKITIFGIWQKDENGRIKITSSVPSDISQFYVKKVLTGYAGQGNPIYKPQGEFWLKHSNARRCEIVIFKPNAPPKDGIFNLWQGFSCIPRKGSWTLFHDHLFNNICGEKKEYYDYLIGWIARMFQYPDSQGEVAVVLKGGRGVGKGKFVTILGKILGQHFLHISNARHLVGNFNAHLMDCILLFADEAFWAGDKQGESVLKVLITEKMNLIEAKGKDPFSFPNYLHIIMASNLSWVVPAGNDERRYFVLNVSDRRKQDKKYFAAIDDEMMNGGYEAFLYDMLNYDLTGFEVRDVPKTEALLEQKLQSMPPHQHWWYGILQEGRLLPDDKEWCSEVKKNALQQYYADTLHLAGQRHRAYATQLGRYLQELVPQLRSASKPPRYIFPPLELCRAHFAKMMDAEIDWLESEIEEEGVEMDKLPF